MVTLKDIAEVTGVSKAAVSSALSGRGRLGPDTRQRIVTVAEKLGYRPNLLIRGVQTRRSQSIGVILNTASSFRMLTAKGISDYLLELDYVPLFLYQKEGYTTEDLLFKLIDRRVDGLIFKPESKFSVYDNLEELLKRNTPVVVIDSEVQRHPELDFVGVDNFLGGRLAAEYLIDHGHRRLGFMGNAECRSSEERGRGFEKVAAGCMNCSVVNVETNGDCTETVKQAACELLGRAERPTALFAYNDQVAYGIYQAAWELGLSVPDDLSVVGFADLELARYVEPGLTTFNQFPEKNGSLAAELLVDRIEDKTSEQRRILLKPQLIERKSVAKQRS